MKVQLTLVEVMLASYAGTLRRVEAIKKNRENNHGISENLWETDILGCLGEMAVAKAFGFYWGGNLGTFKNPDLPGRVQVRATSKRDGRLIVRLDDHVEDAYVLTIVNVPYCQIMGWLTGMEAKKEGWLTDFGNPHREKCYGVPQSSLNTLETLFGW